MYGNSERRKKERKKEDKEEENNERAYEAWNLTDPKLSL
jgi:hypothetical protein